MGGIVGGLFGGGSPPSPNTRAITTGSPMFSPSSHMAFSTTAT